MLEHIENMRSKPEHVRRRYAFVVSFSITAVIFFGWIASYGLSSSPVLTQKSADGETSVEAPVSSLTASVVGAYDDIKSIFFGSNKVDYSSSIEVTAGKR
jgi:hypothetical protein